MNGLNRTVAIKRMIAEDVSRFQSEARAIAAINYPAKRHFAPEAISSRNDPGAIVVPPPGLRSIEIWFLPCTDR